MIGSPASCAEATHPRRLSCPAAQTDHGRAGRRNPKLQYRRHLPTPRRIPRTCVDPRTAGCPEHASAAKPDPQAAQAGDLGEPGHAGVDAGGGEDDHRSPGIRTYGIFRAQMGRGWRPPNLADWRWLNATRTARRSRHDRDYTESRSSPDLSSRASGTTSWY